MKLAKAFVLAVLFVICTAKDDSLDDQWEDFKLLYNKQYDGDEIERRIIWESNLIFIRDHNHKANKNIYSYYLGMNQFGDMTQDEINGIMLFTKKPHSDEGHNDNKHHEHDIHYFKAHNNGPIPDDIDWRESGRVTVVKNQGYNNASWAFATVGAIEGELVRKKQQLINLSEQQLIDCSRHTHFIWQTSVAAMEYVETNGIQSEETYPYTGIRGNCSYNKDFVVGKTGHCVSLPVPLDYKMKNFVARKGPVSVAIDGSLKSFHFYKRGVYDDKNCSTTHRNHEALVVGYTKDYWLVKNSWGPSWGDDGYIKIAQNKGNQCGIASRICYPQM